MYMPRAYPRGKVEGNSVTYQPDVETKPVRTRTLKDTITSVRGSQTCHHLGQRSGISSKNSNFGQISTIQSHLHT